MCLRHFLMCYSLGLLTARDNAGIKHTVISSRSMVYTVCKKVCYTYQNHYVFLFIFQMVT